VGTERRALHEGCAAPGEGIENGLPRLEVAAEEDLDELSDELPEVGMESVDILRPLALGQLGFRPRELSIQVG
jgi:hypothetical protein